MIRQTTFDVSAENILDDSGSSLISNISDNKEENNPHEVRININLTANRPVLAREITPPIQRQNLPNESVSVIPPYIAKTAGAFGFVAYTMTSPAHLPTLIINTGAAALIGGFVGAGIGVITEAHFEEAAAETLQRNQDLENGEP
jgi:hypothetical protein